MRQFYSLIITLILILIFHNEVIAGAQTGLLLWYQTLIPALLPFLLITNALSEINAYEMIGERYIQRFPRIYEYICIILGNLCGYPIGGKIINDFVNKKYITPDNANSILALSSQASPMFLLGYVYVHILNRELPLAIYIASIYLPVIVLYICKIISMKTPAKAYTSNKSRTASKIYVNNTFLEASKTMLFIGIYVIIFSIILNILLIVITNVKVRCMLSALEITTGLSLIQSFPLPGNTKMYICIWLSSFGGLCAAYQIKSVLTYTGASIKKYLIDKIILSSGTYIIIWLYLR